MAFGGRGDQLAGTVPGHDRGAQLVAGQDADGVRGDHGRLGGIGWARQVVAQREPDPARRWRDAEHDQA